MCQLDSTNIIEPISFDLTGDGYPDVCTYDGSYLRCYTQSCALITQTAFSTTSNPVLTNFNNDNFLEVSYVNSSTTATNLHTIQYNYSTDSWSEIWNLISTHGSGSLTGFGCNAVAGSDLKVCFAQISGGNMTVFNYTTNTTATTDTETSTANYPDKNFLPASAVFDNTLKNNIYFPEFTTYFDAYHPRMEFYDLNRVKQFTTVAGNIVTDSNPVNNVFWEQKAIVEIDGLKRFVYSFHHYKNAVTNGLRLYYSGMSYTSGWNNDTDGMQINLISSSYVMSNWAVGDYAKNGHQYACHLENSTSSILLKCYDGNGVLKELGDYTGQMNMTDNIVMADFDNSKSTLGIATEEGIFYTTGAIFRTGFNSSIEGSSGVSGTRSGGKGIVVANPNGNTPVYAYGDGVYNFIISNINNSGSCGNGILDNFESCFSCPADCLANQTVNQTAVAGDYCFPDDDVCKNEIAYFSTICEFNPTWFNPLGLSCTQESTYWASCNKTQSYFLAHNSFITNTTFNYHTEYFLSANIDDIQFCPLGCNKQTNTCYGNVSNNCSPTYQVCSDGIDFSTPVLNGSVYTCRSDGTGWDLTKTCQGGLNCTEFSTTYAECLNSTSIIGSPIFTLSDDNYPCTESADCNSNYCYLNRCTLKSDYMNCGSYKECVSQTCIKGKCTKAGLWANIDYSASHSVGKKSLDVLVWIIIGLFAIVIMIFAIKSGSVWGVILGFVMVMLELNLLLLFFALKGWIDGWWFIVLFIIEMLLGFVVFMIFGRNS